MHLVPLKEQMHPSFDNLSLDLFVVGIGVIDVSYDEKIYHIYCSDTNDKNDYLLHIYSTVKRNVEEVEECTIYRAAGTIAPGTSEAWDSHIRNFSQQHIEFGHMIYDRVWNPDAPGSVEFIPFEETVLRKGKTLHFKTSVLLYERKLSDSEIEYLLVTIDEELHPETHDVDKASITLWVGVPIDKMNINVL